MLRNVLITEGSVDAQQAGVKTVSRGIIDIKAPAAFRGVGVLIKLLQDSQFT